MPCDRCQIRLSPLAPGLVLTTDRPRPILKKCPLSNLSQPATPATPSEGHNISDLVDSSYIDASATPDMSTSTSSTTLTDFLVRTPGTSTSPRVYSPSENPLDALESEHFVIKKFYVGEGEEEEDPYILHDMAEEEDDDDEDDHDHAYEEHEEQAASLVNEVGHGKGGEVEAPVTSIFRALLGVPDLLSNLLDMGMMIFFIFADIGIALCLRICGIFESITGCLPLRRLAGVPEIQEIGDRSVVSCPPTSQPWPSLTCGSRRVQTLHCLDHSRRSPPLSRPPPPPSPIPPRTSVEIRKCLPPAETCFDGSWHSLPRCSKPRLSNSSFCATRKSSASVRHHRPFRLFPVELEIGRERSSSTRRQGLPLISPPSIRAVSPTRQKNTSRLPGSSFVLVPKSIRSELVRARPVSPSGSIRRITSRRLLQDKTVGSESPRRPTR